MRPNHHDGALDRRLFLPIALTAALAPAAALTACAGGPRRSATAALPATPAPQDPVLRSYPETRSATSILAPGAFDGRRQLIDRMTVHHSASKLRRAADAAPVDAAMIADWHTQRGLNGPYQGTEGCAYHFVVMPDGEVQTGRPLNVQGSGTKNMDDNRRSVAFVLVGDFTKRAPDGDWVRPTAEQLRVLEALALWAMDTYGFGPELVHGHREVARSDCPGPGMDMNAFRRRLGTALRSDGRRLRPPIVLLP